MSVNAKHSFHKKISFRRLKQNGVTSHVTKKSSDWYNCQLKNWSNNQILPLILANLISPLGKKLDGAFLQQNTSSYLQWLKYLTLYFGLDFTDSLCYPKRKVFSTTFYKVSEFKMFRNTFQIYIDIASKIICESHTGLSEDDNTINSRVVSWTK